MLRFILFGLALISLAACKNELAEIEALTDNYSTNVETAKEVEILYSDSAQVRVRITGPTMLYHLDRTQPHQEFPDGVNVDFYDAEGLVTGELTARYGVRYENRGEVVVRDSVVWKSTEGEKLETEELIWDEHTGKVYTKKFVVVTRPDEIIYGHGFEADQNFTYSRINAIEGRIKVEEPAEE